MKVDTDPFPLAANNVAHTVLLMLLAMLARTATAFSADEVLYEQKLGAGPYAITIPVTIGNQTYTFMLDTGAGFQCVDPALSKLLGPYRYIAPMETSGHDIHLEIYDAPPISIGRWSMPRSQAFVFDLEPFRGLWGSNIRGVVSSNELKDCALFLDFDLDVLKIMRGGFIPPIPMETIQLENKPYHEPVIKQKIEDKVVEFTIDTGDADCISLDHDTFVTLVASGAIERDQALSSLTVTMLGTAPLPSGHFTRGELLGVDLTGVAVDESSNLIGMEFLCNFNAIIDFKNGRFSYERHKCSPPIWPHKMLGVALKFSEKHNHVFILDADHSAARDAGLKIWDRIIQLGPLEESDLTYESIYELCLNHAEETLEVKVLRPGVSEPFTTQLTLPKKQFVYPPREIK